MKLSVVLALDNDWKDWIEIIQTISRREGIWDYVNPYKTKIEIETLHLREPLQPHFLNEYTPIQYSLESASSSTAIPGNPIRRSLNDYEKDELQAYRREKERLARKFEDQKKAMEDLRGTIQQSIDRTLLPYTYECENPYDMLVKLKRRFAPTDFAQQEDLLEKWRQLQTLGKRVDVEKWLMNWEVTYDTCISKKVPYIDGNRPVQEFLAAVKGIAPGFTDGIILQMSQNTDKSYDLHEIIQSFRYFRRQNKDMVKPRGSHGVFEASLQNRTADGDLRSRSNSRKPKDNKPRQACLCGEFHWFNQCFYLNEAVRPKGWLPKKKLSEAIAKEIASSPGLKARIAKNIENNKKYMEKNRTEQKGVFQADSDESETETGFTVTQLFENLNMSVISQGAMASSETYKLRKSTILDSGATLHVCNDRTRMRNVRPAGRNDRIAAGSDILQIEAFGDMDIQAPCKSKPGKVRVITLLNCALVSGFQTNVASLRKFSKKNMSWDQKSLLYMSAGKQKVLCETPFIHNQWVLEYVQIDESVFATSSYKDTPTQGSMQEWHCRFGHANVKALSHLSNATRNAKLTNATTYEKICDICRKMNAKSKVSRRPAVRATVPYERVHFDLIPMKEGSSGDALIAHFICDLVRMNHVYILPNKRQETLMNTVQDFIAYVKTRWEYTVRIFHMDGERGLQTQFDAWAAENGVTIELTPPYTKEPNANIERSGRSLTVRATGLRLEGKLPANMWSEIYIAAGYIMNRTPTKALEWETPLGLLQKLKGISPYQPSVGHIRSYGCKAYAQNKTLDKLDRLESRAHVGFLVGYHASNIWKIWVPSLNRVILSRDVTFDETKHYSEPYVEECLPQTIEKVVSAIEIPDKFAVTRGVRDHDIPYTIEDNVEDVREKEVEKSGENRAKDAEISLQQAGPTGILTPRETPEPYISPYPPLPMATQLLSSSELPSTLEATGLANTEPSVSTQSSKNVPSQTLSAVSADIDPAHIQKGKRNRVSTRRAAYVTALHMDQPNEFVFHTAFNAIDRIPRHKFHRTDLPSPPKYWKEMLAHSHKDSFMAAAIKEYSALKARDTFIEVQSSDHTDEEPLPLMWVFTYKFDNNGYLEKYKARLVARGDLQRNSIFQETYAATLGAKTFRALCAIANYFDLEMKQFDAVSAFTNSQIDEKIIVQCPEGFGQPGKVLLLQKALYGLRRSPLLWFNDLSRTLTSLGLVRVPEAQCLFISPKVMCFFYVDDISVLYHRNFTAEYDEFRTGLMQAYELKDLGDLKWFLGIRIIRDRQLRKLWLCQDSYIDKLVDTFNISTTNPATTPMLTHVLEPFDGQATVQEIHAYQQRVGSLNYSAVITRPDISFAAGKLARYNTNPGPKHLQAADRVLEYLAGTKHLALMYDARTTQPRFEMSSDASFADDVKTKRSTQGYAAKLLGGLFDYSSTLQKSVTRATTEAELLGLSHAATQLYWWIRFFEAIQLDLDEDISLKCDNMQTVRLMLKESPKLVTALKHIDIHQHWLRQEVQRNNLRIDWISTGEMVADGFTKALPIQKHLAFLKNICMENVSAEMLF